MKTKLQHMLITGMLIFSFPVLAVVQLLAMLPKAVAMCVDTIYFRDHEHIKMGRLSMVSIVAAANYFMLGYWIWG